jgi:hypothetical protein
LKGVCNPSVEYKMRIVGILLMVLTCVSGQNNNAGADNILRQRRKVIRVDELNTQPKTSSSSNMYGENVKHSGNSRNIVEKNGIQREDVVARNPIIARDILKAEAGWSFDRFLFDSSLSMCMSMCMSMSISTADDYNY